jgi:hypothetical protein
MEQRNLKSIYEGLPSSCILELRTKYSNERPFCDGDIFRHLLYFRRRADLTQQNKWLSRLSESKRKDIKKLLEKMPRLRDAFDNLLPLIGLWPALRLGTLHRILTLKCDEVIIITKAG